MKKIIAGTVMATALLTALPSSWPALDGHAYAAAKKNTAASHYIVNVNGNLMTVRSLHRSGTVLLAGSDMAKLFSADYRYDPKHQYYEIRRTSPNIRMVLQTGKKAALVNGKSISLSVAPQRFGQELYVDAKQIAALLGGQWKAEAGVAIVSTSGSFRPFRETWQVNGSTATIHGLVLGQTSFYSVNDVAAAFGATVHVDKKTSMVKVKKGNRTIIFNPFSYVLNAGGKKTSLPTAPFIQNGVPYINLSAIVYALGERSRSKSDLSPRLVSSKERASIHNGSIKIHCSSADRMKPLHCFWTFARERLSVPSTKWILRYHLMGKKRLTSMKTVICLS
ncbi:stalk domain-containing protein [Geobacillus sp. JS12]|uniref:stalk domain-containing protein n=1 Tax=Geobacillus sp. JS12 TaxID=1813182 RepID=UPI000A5FE8DD|nr:stalk domain-containing protein [Geobacillus sp. JS12]